MTADPPIVLDTSALVALMLQESGADTVRSVLHRARVSAVSVSEAIEVLARKAGVGADVTGTLPPACLEPFDRQQALAAGDLLIAHRRKNLSLGDACCLALALVLRAEVFTADRSWANLSLPLQVRLIR